MDRELERRRSGSDPMYMGLLAISQAIAGLTDGEIVMQTCSTEFRNLVPHDHMDVALIEKNDRINQVYEAWLRTDWSNAAPGSMIVAKSPIRLVLLGHEPYLLTGDAINDLRFHFPGADDGPIFDENLRSRIHVPLRVQGTIIGAISISSHAADCYDHSDVVLTQHCADLLAPYFWALSRAEEASRAARAESEAKSREEFLRVGALRLTEGMETERRRIGMDLHDQTLADLARIVRVVAKLRMQTSVSQEQLASVEQALITCLGDLRGIIEDMKPGILDVFGLEYAVEAILSPNELAIESPFEWKVRDCTKGAVDRLPTSVRTALFRVVQEAINNAMTHSHCSRIDVTISQEDGNTMVSVDDNGIGISKKLLRTAKGGLSHMRTRSKLMGGQVAIARGPGDIGTRVVVTVPFTSEPVSSLAAET